MGGLISEHYYRICNMNIFMYDLKLSWLLYRLQSSQVISHVVNPLPLGVYEMWLNRENYVLKEFCLLGHNTVWSGESQPHSEGMYYLHIQDRRICQARNQRDSRWEADLLLFDPEDRDETFLQNVSCLSMDYRSLYPRRQNSSFWTMSIILVIF
jgi:hypothetical protein